MFILAGLCEIGGGYLIWLWLRENRPWYYGLFGAVILAGYGVVATFQSVSFGRVCTAFVKPLARVLHVHPKFLRILFLLVVAAAQVALGRVSL